jgi:hypothetical protein
MAAMLKGSGGSKIGPISQATRAAQGRPSAEYRTTAVSICSVHLRNAVF